MLVPNVHPNLNLCSYCLIPVSFSTNHHELFINANLENVLEESDEISTRSNGKKNCQFVRLMLLQTTFMLVNTNNLKESSIQLQTNQVKSSLNMTINKSHDSTIPIKKPTTFDQDNSHSSKQTPLISSAYKTPSDKSSEITHGLNSNHLQDRFDYSGGKLTPLLVDLTEDSSPDQSKLSSSSSTSSVSLFASVNANLSQTSANSNRLNGNIKTPRSVTSSQKSILKSEPRKQPVLTDSDSDSETRKEQHFAKRRSVAIKIVTTTTEGFASD